MRNIILVIVCSALSLCTFVSCNKVNHDDAHKDSAFDLSKKGTANCYIVSQEGRYKFEVRVGNSRERITDVDTVAVLWESYGNSEPVNVGDLLQIDKFASGYVYFTATQKKGNALVAVMDKDRNILWSWHIWMTDKPQDQVYANNAGVMMDRNLGATLTVPGSLESLGLLYQWGRKDPFPGGGILKGDGQPACVTTGTFVFLENEPSCRTIEYSIAHPMTILGPNTTIVDWLEPLKSGLSDNTRWQKDKTIYDPCPAGYKVPEMSVWTNALGATQATVQFDSELRGVDFGSSSKAPMGDYDQIWYPMNGYAYKLTCTSVGDYCYLWSCETDSYKGRYFFTSYRGDPNTSYSWQKCLRYGVRCCKE